MSEVSMVRSGDAGASRTNLGGLRTRRRFLLVALLVATVAALSVNLLMNLSENGLSLLEGIYIALSAIAFLWIGLSFWISIIGFVVRFIFRNKAVQAILPLARHALSDKAPQGRTAVVMPAYNEDPAMVFLGMEKTLRSVLATGHGEAFDFFVLSDTTDPDIAARERIEWLRLAHRYGLQDRLIYRRREKNTGRKVGNIKDFCDRWGDMYDFMVVLDADSIMSGATILKLVRMMEAQPDTGLIQALPRAMGQKTLFGRLTQFNIRLSGELFTTGLTYWTLNDGNYWGHNAILRLAPFMEHCELPHLSGKGPLSGQVLSHDFVEAAFLRRAGWDVWIYPEGRGSYEQVPPNTIDHIVRDQRWCQGNFQHMRIVGEKGLKPLSRLHMLMGVMSYASSFLWMMLLVLSAFLVTERTMPISPVIDLPGELSLLAPYVISPLALFGVVMSMLFAPKVLAMLLALREARPYGGALRLVPSTLLEMFASALIAPVMMVFHVRIISALLIGKTVQWNAQARSGRAISWSEALRQHSVHYLVAALLSAIYSLQAPELLPWLAPILAGLLLAAPFSILLGKESCGLALRRLGLLLIPEETEPPEELPRMEHDSELPLDLLGEKAEVMPKAAE